MIDDAGQEIELGMWYRLLEEKQDLLAEVKRLRGRHVAFMQWMIQNYDEIVNEWEASE